ncbi:MAG: hypothetical protein ACLFV6_16440 [Spirulinaceae cyanobacterium]
MPINPENAWLLLTKNHLYLMVSDRDNSYYDKRDVGKTPANEVEVKGIPIGWFIKERNLVVNYDKDDSEFKKVEFP